VAVGLLLLQGPRLLHLLLVAHATCEHGELVELGELVDVKERAELGQRAPAPAVQLAPEREAEQVRASVAHSAHSAHTDGSGHDHCDALALRHLPAAFSPSFAAPPDR